MKLSVVSPVYEAEEIIPELVLRVSEEAVKLSLDFEIVLVEDGSADDSWTVIEKLCSTHPKLIGVKLSRNFGQHYAITAGIAHASGDAIILMDCDLQDDPKYFKDLLSKYEQGFDIVYTVRKSRKHAKWKNLTALLYNFLFNLLVRKSDFHTTGSMGTFSLLSRKAAKGFLEVNDYHRHYLMILRWLGFGSSFVIVEHQKRLAGKSSYSMSRLLRHAINGITSQSDRLLNLGVIVGFVMSFLAFLSALYIVIQAFMSPFKAGWASTSVLILFVGGLIITFIGIIGIYIGKIFEQSKSRPLYIIDKVLNK